MNTPNDTKDELTSKINFDSVSYEIERIKGYRNTTMVGGIASAVVGTFFLYHAFSTPSAPHIQNEIDSRVAAVTTQKAQEALPDMVQQALKNGDKTVTIDFNSNTINLSRIESEAAQQASDDIQEQKMGAAFLSLTLLGTSIVLLKTAARDQKELDTARRVLSRFKDPTGPV